MASVIISVSQGEKSYVTLVILDIFKVIYKDLVPRLCSRMIIQHTLLLSDGYSLEQSQISSHY